MGEGSDCEVEDYDAVQSGMLLVLLTFWFFFFGGTEGLLLQNKSELRWEVGGYTGEVVPECTAAQPAGL